MRTEVGVVVLGLAGLLSGCGSMNQVSVAPRGSESEQLALREFEPIDGKVSVYVCWDGDMGGKLYSTQIAADDRTFATLTAPSFGHVVLEPGRHTIGVWNAGSHQWTRVERDLKAGDVYFLHYWYNAFPVVGGYKLTEFREDQGENVAEGERCVWHAPYNIAS